MEFLSVPLPEDIEKLEKCGNFREARKKIDEYLARDYPQDMLLRLEYEKERLFRLRKEYSIPVSKAEEILKKNVKNFTLQKMEKWLKNGSLDCMQIDGRMRCFSRFLPNLVFAEPFLSTKKRKVDEKIKSLRLETIKRINIGELRKYRITAGIRLGIKKRYQPKFRVWLPVPKEGFQVENVRILFSSPDFSFISDGAQRTAYFETKEREIKLEFSYEISEIGGGIEEEVKKEYLEEKYPHIVFSPYLKNLAHEIIGEEENDWEKARKIYEWVTSHMRYFYVKNYGIYRNIGEYAATNLKGDCGFHATLFITLCRILGIPAKWQSGWYVTPYYTGPHDWAQFYADGKWYPVDASFGNARRHTQEENRFYFGNLDAFRMIANDDLLTDFEPEKEFWRSDPVDNQVGEVETEEKNIYYDGFTWKIYAKEIKKI